MPQFTPEQSHLLDHFVKYVREHYSEPLNNGSVLVPFITKDQWVDYGLLTPGTHGVLTLRLRSVFPQLEQSGLSVLAVVNYANWALCQLSPNEVADIYTREICYTLNGPREVVSVERKNHPHGL